MGDRLAALLTIEAASPGGVPTLVDTIYPLMEARGYEPTVYRAQFAAGALSFGQRVGVTLRNWRPKLVEERGMRTVIVPAPPVPLWLFYVVPHFLTGSLLGKYRSVFVASGSAHVALPLALRGTPYTLWIATVYEDELRGKAEVGDAWARGVLTSPMWRLIEAQERYVLRRADHILALSPYAARRIAEIAPETKDRIRTVLLPVDTDRYRPDESARSGSAYGRYLFLAARINDPRKNVPMLLRAFARIRARLTDLKLVLVGEEPDETLRGLVDALGLAEAVCFPGIVSRDDLLQLYQGAELFVLPSRQEGLGIVMLEAMACGTPVIATDCGGPEGIVLDGITGRIVPNDDAEQFAQAVIDTLSDPGELAAMRQRCRDFAVERWSREVVEETLVQHFELTASTRSAGRVRETAAAMWAILVTAAYVQHQLALNGDAVRRLISTLFASQ